MFVLNMAYVNAVFFFFTIGRRQQMAQNRFTLSGQRNHEPEQKGRQKVPLFDLRETLVPLSFIPRNDTAPKIPVTPLSEHIERFVNSSLTGDNKNWMQDAQNLLSYHHLGYICARFMGPNGVQASSSQEHPIWAMLADEIDSPPPPGPQNLSENWSPGCPHPLEGLSTLMCDYRVELATNFKNFWDGKLYYKCLEFLLRFSLRFHLVPDREMRYYERTLALVDKKIRAKEEARVQSTHSHKSWIDQVNRSKMVWVPSSFWRISGSYPRINGVSYNAS